MSRKLFLLILLSALAAGVSGQTLERIPDSVWSARPAKPGETPPLKPGEKSPRTCFDAAGITIAPIVTPAQRQGSAPSSSVAASPGAISTGAAADERKKELERIEVMRKEITDGITAVVRSRPGAPGFITIHGDIVPEHSAIPCKGVSTPKCPVLVSIGECDVSIQFPDADKPESVALDPFFFAE